MADLESIHTEYTKGTVNSNEYATGNVNSNEYAAGNVDSKEYATVNVDSNEYTTVNANSNEYTIGNVNFHEYATETGNSDDYPTEIVNSGYTTIAVSSIEYTPVTVNSNSNLSIAPHDFDHDWTTTVSMGGYWSPFDRTNHGKKTVWSAGTGFEQSHGSHPFLGLSAYVLMSQENILNRVLEYFMINDSMQTYVQGTSSIISWYPC